LGRKSGKPDDDPFVANALRSLAEIKAKREAEKPMSKQLQEAHRSVEQWKRKVAEKENLAESAREKMQKAIDFSKAADNVLLNARNGLETAEKYQQGLTKSAQKANSTQFDQLSPEKQVVFKQCLERAGLMAGLNAVDLVEELVARQIPAGGTHPRPPPTIPASVPGSGEGGTPVVPTSVPDSSRGVPSPVVEVSHSSQVQNFSIASQVGDTPDGVMVDADDEAEDEAELEEKHRRKLEEVQQQLKAEKETFLRRKSAKGRRTD